MQGNKGYGKWSGHLPFLPQSNLKFKGHSQVSLNHNLKFSLVLRILRHETSRHEGTFSTADFGGTVVALAVMGGLVWHIKLPEKDSNLVAYFPLKTGNKWTYSVKYSSSNKADLMIWEVGRRVQVKGGHSFEIRFNSGEHKIYQYWASRSNGIFRYRNLLINYGKGVIQSLPPRCILRPPLTPGTTWNWKEDILVQTDGEVDPDVDPKTLSVNCSATIAKTDGKVSVPAGVFSAVQVDIRYSGPMVGTRQETFWFAPEVGMVKRWVSNTSPMAVGINEGLISSAQATIELIEFGRAGQ